ncbi:MAG: ATP-binding cassette domain-containing protein, partial [Pseudonocardiaceae bacterium]
MIEATGIDVGYDGTLVLNRVELTAQPGRVVGLIGPNGSGKTTLLRTLYRSLRPQAGQVTLDGTSLERLTTREVARLVAVVVQESPVELPFTVAEMVRLGRSPHRSTFQGYAADDHLIAAAALARVGARHLAERTFATLSGGEKQRVLNAQALAQQATHLLLDEPTNHLDVRYQHEVLELVRSIGVTTVIVLHDLNLAARYCDELVLLDQGRVTCVGPPRQVLTPEVLEPVYGVAVRCLEDGDAIQLLFRSATPHTGKGSAPVAVDSDNDLYLDGDPRAERNRLSIARGAGHVTIWSRRLISLGRDQRRSMTVMLVIGLLITTSYVVQGLLVAEALTQVLVAGRLDGVVPILATAVALTVARGGLVWWRESLGAALGEQVCAGLRTRLYRQLARLGPAWLKQTRTGAVQTTLTAPSTRWRSTSGCSCPRRWSAPSARRPSSPTCARSIWSSGCSWRAACSSPGSPNYWDGELPYLDELRRVDAPDEATASQGVLSGNFDVAAALS